MRLWRFSNNCLANSGRRLAGREMEDERDTLGHWGLLGVYSVGGGNGDLLAVVRSALIEIREAAAHELLE